MLDLSKSDHFNAYQTIVNAAVIKNSLALQHAKLDMLDLSKSAHFNTYQNIVTAAVTESRYALQYAKLELLNFKNSNHLATIKHILLAAIKHHGLNQVFDIMLWVKKNFELKPTTLRFWMAQEKINLAWQRCKAHITPTFAKCFTGQPPQQPPSPSQP